MIRLHPHPEAEHDCPHCRVRLGVSGWLMPGMRALADLRCPACGREFYGDLKTGQALYTPMLLEKDTGAVHDAHGVGWYAGWLRDSYARRTDAPVPFSVRESRAVRRPVVLLNCLDTLYGHSLLKLLNAQHYLDRRPDVDLIVVVPDALAWMVPDGVAQTWVVGLPLRRGTEWNDWLAREIRRRVETFGSVSLSTAPSHPRPVDYDIERFTRVRPFPLEEWGARLLRPRVTFAWRDDRCWEVPRDRSAAQRPGGIRRLTRRSPAAPAGQASLVSELAEALRAGRPALDFAVAGLAESVSRGEFPPWVEDLRSTGVSEETERRWCLLYAGSHVVVGVHGSNMLLPSGHAGSVVELLGPERWGNFTQDILFRQHDDCREMFFRYRFIPTTTPPREVAGLVESLLGGREPFRRLMNTGPHHRG
ncbi:MAG TPA: hypothetical protein VEY09_00240 [Pyrinomonadaceae bacterium]|nr:hypothetical protein [Pyrinomonadaceae bacterium]